MNRFIASIIICTYQRPRSIYTLLSSLSVQTVPIDEIIIVDGSLDDATERHIASFIDTMQVKYTRVLPDHRGLTRQRNVGVNMASSNSDILVFLDDDVVLMHNFLEEILATFNDRDVIGADGLIINECRWLKTQESETISPSALVLDGYYLPLPLRDKVRKWLGLFPSEMQPGKIPPYGHGKSSLPPSGKQYEVEHIMGCNTAYRKIVFSHIQFSNYFEGYGLYEDFDFSVRANRYGKLITNTSAKLEHHHEPAGRPNTFKYGEMVVKNGWYVWKLKHPNPGYVNVLKWYSITILLALFRLTGAFSINQEMRRQALGDLAGRIKALVILLFIKPSINKL